MKKNLLLCVLALLFSVAYGQSDSFKSEFRTNPANTSKAITGSISMANPLYSAGLTTNLVFTYNHSSPDVEYTDGISLDFPVGVTVNSAPDFDLEWNGEIGNGVITSWGNIAGGSGLGELSSSINFTVNVTIDAAFTGTLDVVWLIVGDGYGASPHSTTGTIAMTGLSTVDLKVASVSPSQMFSGETVHPEMIVKNLGSLIANDFSLTIAISDGTNNVYTSTKNITAAGLASLASQTYTMDDSWTPEDGLYTITASATLVGDLNLTNNEITQNCEVAPIELGDVIAYFPTQNPGCPGVETDGINIYTAYWNSGNFDKYTMDGTYIETFTVAGASNLRDMAYDGQYFYGSAGTTSLFQMDLANATLISTITAPVAVRAIAYDDDNNTLWANNWDTDLTEFSLSGIATGNSFASPSIYGAAYDNWSDPLNPTMWLFIGTGADTQTALVEYRLDGTATGRSIDVSAFPGFTAGAGSGSGGLASYEEDGIAYLLVNVQQDPNMIYKVFLFQALPLEEPQVVSYLPENSATNVAVDAVISATFDVDITAVDLTGITITPNPGSVSASITGDVLTIAHGDLAFNTIYTVLVPAGAVSAGTVNLASNIQWSFTTVDPVGIDVNKIAAISVYPNPANNVITVANAENKDIVVLNILGKVVAAVSSATSHQTINISNLSAGIYFVKVNTEVFKINVIK